MGWNDVYPDLPSAETIRPTLLRADDTRRSALPGCTMLTLYVLLLCVGLPAFGWLIAGIRFP